MSRIVAFFLAFGITSSYADNVHLRGRIFHPLSDSVKIFYYFPSIAYHPVEQIIPLDKSGKFEYSFDVPHGYTNIAVTNGDQTTELFVSPGSDLQMTVDASHFDSTMHYEGNGKEIANFMAKHTLERHMLSEFNFGGQKLACTESPNGFLKDLDALENSEIKFLLDNQASLPQSFVHYLTIYFRYSKYDMMEMYPRQHEMCRQRKNIIKDIPPEDYTVIDNIPLAYNDSFIDNPGYIGFLTNILFIKAMADSAKTSHDSLSYPPGDTIEAIAYRTMPRKTAEYYLGSHLVRQISSYSPERVNQK